MQQDSVYYYNVSGRKRSQIDLLSLTNLSMTYNFLTESISPNVIVRTERTEERLAEKEKKKKQQIRESINYFDKMLTRNNSVEKQDKSNTKYFKTPLMNSPIVSSLTKPYIETQRAKPILSMSNTNPIKH